MKHFKQTIHQGVVLAVILCFSLLNGRILFYRFLFAFNQAKLIATVCEKKKLNCHAHCFLEKQINAAENDDHKASPYSSQPPSRVQSLPEVDLFPPSSIGGNIDPPPYHLLPSSDLSCEAEGYRPAVFHPPEV